MLKQNYVKEISLTLLALVWFLFAATNVNTQLGTIYSAFALASGILLVIGIAIFDKSIHITFQKSPGGTLQAIFVGFMGWIALMVASVAVLKIADPTSASLGSVLSLLGATTPALSTSVVANFITFGIVIAFIETQLWARGLEFVADVFNIPLEKKGITKVFTALMVLIIILAIVFILFHLTSKNLSGPSLIIVGIMMVVSMIMVVWFGETRQAVWTHIISNSVASYILLTGAGSII
jgi:hypothetical protein